MEELPRCTSLVPLAFPCLVLCLLRAEIEGLLDYQGRAGIISIVRWNLPVIFGVNKLKTTPTPNKNGSYCIKTGGFVCHILGVRMPYFLQKSLDFNRDLCHTDPPLYGIYWGHIFCKYGGWGWSELFFIRPPPKNSELPPPLTILYALYFAGKNDTSIKNSGPETSLQDPLPLRHRWPSTRVKKASP